MSRMPTIVQISPLPRMSLTLLRVDVGTLCTDGITRTLCASVQVSATLTGTTVRARAIASGRAGKG